jgi:integrase
MQRDRLLFELLLFTGMRIGEALSLDIHAIGVSKVGETVQDLPMQNAKDDYSQGNRYRQQKSGPRDLFIPTTLMKKLSAYYESVWLDIYAKKEMHHEFFFISEFHNNLGDPLSYQAVWDRCRKVGKACGIMFTPHDFRHTFATTLARNDVGIERLRILLGHRDLESTSLYIEFASKEEMVEELIPFYESYGISHER